MRLGNLRQSTLGYTGLVRSSTAGLGPYTVTIDLHRPSAAAACCHHPSSVVAADRHLATGLAGPRFGSFLEHCYLGRFDLHHRELTAGFDPHWDPAVAIRHSSLFECSLSGYNF